jgi:hypothetical protein
MRKQRGCLASLLGVLAVAVAAVYGAAAVTAPWSFHIGGRSTPFLTWWGWGTLRTKDGHSYPLSIYFFPSSRFSRLRLDGLRPTGGLQGSARLCTSRGVVEQLDLSGTIYGGWRSTEGSLIDFRLFERKRFDVGQHTGYFDLYGRFRGPDLVMDDRGRYSSPLRSGLRVEHGSVTFSWGGYRDFQAVCDSAATYAMHP